MVNVSGATINMNQGSLGTVSIWDPVTGQYIVDNHFINGLPVPSTAWLTLRQSLLWNFSTATLILKNCVLAGHHLGPACPLPVRTGFRSVLAT